MKRLDKIGHKTKLFVPGPGARICTKHFTEDNIYRLSTYITLREGAIPTLFKVTDDDELSVS